MEALTSCAGWSCLFLLGILVSHHSQVCGDTIRAYFAHVPHPHRPDFDSPSVFCRLLDKDKGGYFSIAPPIELNCTTKQQYLPSSSILQTRHIHEDGVVDVVDFFPRPKSAKVLTRNNNQSLYRETTQVQGELKKWLVRKVQCIRGSLALGSYTLYHTNVQGGRTQYILTDAS